MGRRIIILSHIISYVRRNLKTVHTIGDVAEHFHVSPETLRRVFKRGTGQSLSSFILHEKIRVMKRKLAMTNERCFEIIYELGFRREDSGARTFRKMTGMTMGQYRREHVPGNKRNSTKRHT